MSAVTVPAVALAGPVAWRCRQCGRVYCVCSRALPRGSALPEPTVDEVYEGRLAPRDVVVVAGDVIRCVSAEEPRTPQAYRDVCTGAGEVVARSVHCPDSLDGGHMPCGGHPICRPCLAVAQAAGILTEVTA